MGLGLGCDQPPPTKQCPYHIGVVLAERWTEYSHEQSQKYADTFDNKTRARDNIKWLVAKGDLITQDEGIAVSQRIIKKLTRNGNRAGAVTLAFSYVDGVTQPPTQMKQSVDGKFLGAQSASAPNIVAGY